MAMGKNKKKKGLKNDPAAILEKGEKFFQKGNYPLAKKEFEKLGEVAGQNDLLKKIEICDQEIQKQNARELLKRARKIEKGGNPQAAVKCFEEAHAILGEDWIREKIERLQNKSQEMDVRRSAKDAEAAGDYLRAAELYDRLISAGESEAMRLRKAICLARGEAYEDAVSAFKPLALEEPVHRYDFGFALGKHYAGKTVQDTDTEKSSLIRVYYMHANFRCTTCNAIEKMAFELLADSYSEELSAGEIVWQAIDFQENEVVAEQFEVAASCVVVAQIEDGKALSYERLDKVWTLTDNPQGFNSYIADIINEYLKKD